MAALPQARAVALAGTVVVGAACCMAQSSQQQQQQTQTPVTAAPELAANGLAPDPAPQPHPEPEPEPEPELANDGDASEAEAEDGTVQWEVCGHTVRVQQQQLSGGAADGTGWRMWNSALVLAKYIETNALHLLQPRLGQRREGDGPVRVLDMSAGPGLLGLACAVCAAEHNLDVEVVLTEMPSPSLLQLEANVTAANEQLGRKYGAAYHPAHVVPFTWGLQPEGAAAESFKAGFDLVLISDCLFIAVRDYLFTQLRSAMVTACTSPGDAEGTLLLFAYEERLTQEEHDFLNDLETNPAIAAGAAGAVQTFTSTEVPEDDLDLECTLDEGELGGLFAEVAPVRILHMHKCKAE